MGDEVGRAVALLVDLFEPVGVGVASAGDEGVLAGEGGVADEGVEAGVVAAEDFRELDRPVEGVDRLWAFVQSLDGLVQVGWVLLAFQDRREKVGVAEA